MKVRACANCGQTPIGHFENETFHITHKAQSIDVKGLAGWRCPSCGEVEFEAKSARRYAAAGDALVIRRGRGIARKSAGFGGNWASARPQPRN
jgi:HTH-type transcriptional regulator/antitoxin MqsA